MIFPNIKNPTIPIGMAVAIETVTDAPTKLRKQKYRMPTNTVHPMM
jgi:hypothetical protein